MPMLTQIQTRKEKRKQKRQKRSQSKIVSEEDIVNTTTLPSPTKSAKRSKKSDVKTNSSRSKGKNDRYGHLASDVAAAMRRDDEEIQEMELKLGLGKKKNKEKLNKEYATLEGYGDDFGDFLDDLDDLMGRVTKTSDDKVDGDKDKEDDEIDDEDESDDNEDDEESENDIIQKESDDKTSVSKKILKNSKRDDLYAKLDPDVAAALRRDDEEIAELEAKLGLGKQKEKKKKLYKEYVQQEGYGEDFGEFMDDLDTMVLRLARPDDDDEENDVDKGHDSEDSDEEELVPMKEPFNPLEEDASMDGENSSEAGSDAEEESSEKELKLSANSQSESEDEGKSDDEEGSHDDSSAVHQQEPDHDARDTYQPSSGEDIYGKTIQDDASNNNRPMSYVPPHLRKKNSADASAEQENRRAIQRALNNALNRLSDDSLIPIARSMSQLYSSYPKSMVNEMIWKNTKNACVSTPILMTGLTPVYMACLAGVSVQTGDTVQLGEYILETVVSELWKELDIARTRTSLENDGNFDEELVDKQCKITCNLILILCYLYNYKIAHCSLLYSVIRNLIENFSDADIECLLILLSHCGQSLRSDDPLALKEIVLLVQKKQLDSTKTILLSRAEYMVSAIMDLKNNKRKKQDTVHTEKAAKFRKLLGRIKSDAASSGAAKTHSEASLRISLDDILNAESKGRWWKVGASWVGNQYRLSGDSEINGKETDKESTVKADKIPEQDEKLLQLATKLRMNTDRKRAIFCIIMGGTDCDDVFEKLCRGGMLQNRSERDTVRVLMECCKQEKSYNKFYSHLASRICDYQPQCKFSFQLAFWDVFKQFSVVEVRKAANLAKLLFHLVAINPVLKLMSVLKAVDVSDDNLDETSTVFLTIFLSSILEFYEDPIQVRGLFERQTQDGKNIDKMEETEGFQASLLVFFLETLKKSPNNKKGSKFRKNFKAAIKALDSDGLENMF